MARSSAGARPESLVGIVANRLRQAIAAGELRPGARIIEAAIARALQISRAPVREAARLLESEGLVTSVSGRGFFVRQITVRELEEIFEVRSCIECHAAAVAAESAAAIRPALEAQLQEIVNAAERGARAEQIAADFHFHRILVEACENRMLLRIFDEIALDLKLVIGLIGEISADWQIIANSHAPLVAAISSGSPDAAIAAIKDHLHLAWDATLMKIRRAADAPVFPSAAQIALPTGNFEPLSKPPFAGASRS